MQQLNGHETINTKLALNTSQTNIDLEAENRNLSPIYSRVFKSLLNNKNDEKFQNQQEEDDELTYRNDDDTDIKSIEEEEEDDEIQNQEDENKLNLNSYQTNNYMYLLNADEECNQTFESQSNQDDTNNNNNKLDDDYFMPKY
jgi:hypothetical protein